MNHGFITIKEACTLLKVSRPTFDRYRKIHKLTENRFRGKTVFSTIEVVKKIILSAPQGNLSDLTCFENSDFNHIHPMPGVFDLRRLNRIDPYGVMLLLCSIRAYLELDKTHCVYLIVNDSIQCSYLDAIGFFTEASRNHSHRVMTNSTDIKPRSQTGATVILPLHLISYRGAEKNILDNLYVALLTQGFSENYCGHIGWIIGELCDNAHEHSQGACYLIIEAFNYLSTQTRHLSFAISDTGIGITNSLKTNLKYSQMSDHRLLPFAFQSEVSRMEVEPRRGKGLNDIIGVAKGNKSWLRVDSGNNSLFFDFQKGDHVSFIKPVACPSGTRFYLVLIDTHFEHVTRDQVNQMMKTFLETI